MSLSSDQNPTPPLPWGIPATIAWVLLSFLVSIVFAAMFYSLSRAGIGGPRNLTYDGVAIAIGVLISVPVQIAVLAVAAQLRRWAPAAYFALNVPRRGEIVFALLCTVVVALAFDSLLYLTGRDVVPPFQSEAYQSAKEAGWLFAFALAVIVAAPVGEEIVFRGFLYRGLTRPAREVLAIVAIALAWALLHIQYDWLGMVQVFAVGLMLGWFRWASGSTTLTIVMHILINLGAMVETAIKMEWLS